MKNEWRGFKGNHWTEDIDVRAFIQDNYTAYDGNADFLAGPTEATNKLWTLLQGLQKEELLILQLIWVKVPKNLKRSLDCKQISL